LEHIPTLTVDTLATVATMASKAATKAAGNAISITKVRSQLPVSGTTSDIPRPGIDHHLEPTLSRF
jgi:hypothetical protein